MRRRKKRKNIKKYQRGGYTGRLYGNSHADGGIPVRVKSTNEMIEVEGGEWIIPERTVKMLGEEFMQNLNDIGVSGRSTSIQRGTLGNGSNYKKGGPVRSNRNNYRGARKYGDGGGTSAPVYNPPGTARSTRTAGGGSVSSNRGANTNIRYVKATDKINRANFLKEINTGSPNPLNRDKKAKDLRNSSVNYTPAYINQESKTFYDCVHPDCWKVCNTTMDCKDPSTNMSCEGNKCVEVRG